jgi:hypothetical protein
MQGLHVAQVLLFFSFAFDDIVYPCTLVHWFVPVNTEPDNVTGMWVVKPEYSGTSSGQQVVSVIHIDSVLRGAHLLPVFGPSFVSPEISYTDSLNVFQAYYVNKFIDHHAYEIAF